MLFIIPFAVFSVAFIKGIATYGQSYIMKYVGQRIITDMQQKLYSHLYIQILAALVIIALVT